MSHPDSGEGRPQGGAGLQWPLPLSSGLHQAVLRRPSLPLEGRQQGLPETRRRSQPWGARKLSVTPGTAPGLRVTCAPCPVWAGAWLGVSGVGSVCRRSRPPGPHAPQSCWRDDRSSCLPAWGCLHGQLVSWARPGGQRRTAGGPCPPQPSSPPTLPSGLAGGKLGLPSCIREDDTGQSPSHQCPGTGCPQNMAPCSLQTPVRVDWSASDSAVASHPPAQLGKPQPGSQAQRAPSQRPYRTRPCPQSAPVPALSWLPWASMGALAKVEWTLTGASRAAHAPPTADPTPPEMDITHLRVRTPSPEQRQTSPE